MLDVALLHKSAGSLYSIYSYIDNGNLTNFLSEVGQSEFKSAIDVLKSMPYVNDKKMTINRVLTHLESAHFIYHKIRMQGKFMTQYKKYFNACKIEYWSNCLMALCHVYLGDDKKIVEVKLDRARDARRGNGEDKESMNHMVQMVTAILASPVFIVGSLLDNSNDDDDGMNDKFFDEFERKILSLY